MSGATSRNRGNTWERQLAEWLRSRGWQAITSRAVRGGTQHGADLITDLPVCVEAKNHARIDLAGWVDQAVGQAGGDLAAVFVKRRGRADPGEGYVVMTADQFERLIRDHPDRLDVEFR
jgi:hypothetical protein